MNGIGWLTSAIVGFNVFVLFYFLALNSAAATRAQIRRAHERGMQVYVWTINDPVQMSVMLSRGADGLITDEPALAREVLDRDALLERVRAEGAEGHRQRSREGPDGDPAARRHGLSSSRSAGGSASWRTSVS